MLTIGDVYVFVSDFKAALRFWVDGLGLHLVEQEASPSSAFATLEFPDEGPAVHLIGGCEAWLEGERPEVGSRPTVRFDVLTTEFDATLVRVLDNGGQQVEEVESYNDMRGVTIADPDGNTLTLIEIPEDETDAHEHEPGE